MTDYRYYASESTLQDINDNLVEFNNNIVTYNENFQLILITIGIIICVGLLEKFVDTLLNKRG